MNTIDVNTVTNDVMLHMCRVDPRGEMAHLNLTKGFCGENDRHFPLRILLRDEIGLLNDQMACWTFEMRLVKNSAQYTECASM